MALTNHVQAGLDLLGPNRGDGSAPCATQVGDGCALADLQGSDFIFVNFHDDVRRIADDFCGAASCATGAIVRNYQESDREVWLSESARPFELSAPYTRFA